MVKYKILNTEARPADNFKKRIYEHDGIHNRIYCNGSAWLLMMGIALVSLIVQWRFKSKFNQYAHEALSSGLSGREVAEKMLHDNGINDVQVVSVEGQLTDHYNPETKTNLSPDVYFNHSVASAAVAAHECGHAVQHARAYAWLSMRTALVPVIQVASTITQ